MTDLKTQHLLTLAHILSKGGKHNFVNITTSSLGREIGKSQQSASPVSYTHLRAHET